MVFLYGLGPTVSPNGLLSEGTITNANVIPRPNSAACPGGVANLDDVIEKMNNGGAYVNVHTVAKPGGEIRGDIGRGPSRAAPPGGTLGEAASPPRSQRSS